MLKIKDNVDLKELEKRDFDDFGVCYKQYGILGEQYFINKGTREVKRIHPYSFREEPTLDEIKMLGISDIVEEV
jgi:hypothetical protein